MLTIELFLSRRRFPWLRRQWYFRIKAANGEIIAQSEGYTRKESALTTIHLLRLRMAIAVLKILN